MDRYTEFEQVVEKLKSIISVVKGKDFNNYSILGNVTKQIVTLNYAPSEYIDFSVTTLVDCPEYVLKTIKYINFHPVWETTATGERLIK